MRICETNPPIETSAPGRLSASRLLPRPPGGGRVAAAGDRISTDEATARNDNGIMTKELAPGAVHPARRTKPTAGLAAEMEWRGKLGEAHGE